MPKPLHSLLCCSQSKKERSTTAWLPIPVESIVSDTYGISLKDEVLEDQGIRPAPSGRWDVLLPTPTVL
jgi:hypothetical protein